MTAASGNTISDNRMCCLFSLAGRSARITNKRMDRCGSHHTPPLGQQSHQRCRTYPFAADRGFDGASSGAMQVQIIGPDGEDVIVVDQRQLYRCDSQSDRFTAGIRPMPTSVLSLRWMSQQVRLACTRRDPGGAAKD